MPGCNLQAQWFVTVRAIVDRPLCVRTNEASSVSSLLRGIGSSAHLGDSAVYSISNLAKLKHLDENASDAMKAFSSFDKAASAPGAIDVLNKQLIAVAVALTTQCPYCIELHTQSARKEGATDEMLAEAAVIAAAMRAGGAITRATHLSKE